MTDSVPLPLFSTLTAFFSPFSPSSSRSAWMRHGGLIATSEAVSDTGCAIDIYFAVSRQPDPLVDRLQALHIELYDVCWIATCVEQHNLVDRTPFSFSWLALHPLPPALTSPIFGPISEQSPFSMSLDASRLPHRTPPSRALFPLTRSPHASSAPAAPVLQDLLTPFTAGHRRTSTTSTAATGASDAAVEQYLLPWPHSRLGISHTTYGGDDNDDTVDAALVPPHPASTEVQGRAEAQASTDSQEPRPHDLAAFFSAPLNGMQGANPAVYDADALLALLRTPGNMQKGVRVVEHGQDGWRVHRLRRDTGGR